MLSFSLECVCLALPCLLCREIGAEQSTKCTIGTALKCLPAWSPAQVLRKQREKDEELERVGVKRDAEAARRCLERKLQLQDKVSGRMGGL